MHEALAYERFIDLVSSKRRFFAVLTMGPALRRGTRMLAFLEGSRDVCWDAVVGRRAVILDFLAHLSP